MEPSQAETATRLHAIDHLKAWAIVAVVFTHAPGPLGFGLPSHPTWRGVLAHAWTPFHVPSFLFASGLLYALAATGPVPLRSVGSRLARVLLPYAVASLLVQAMGLAPQGDLARVVVQLATASSLGIYYYVFLISVCVALLWPISRLPGSLLWIVWGGCVALEVAYVVDPGLRPFPLKWMWSLRDPLENFALGFFLSGWLAAGHLDRLSGWRERHPGWLWCLSGLGVVLGLAYNLGWRPIPLGALPRMLYTFSVIGVFALATSRRPVGPVVRFLSEAGLGLYLFHAIPQILTRPWTGPWGEPRHILAEVCIGLGAATLWLLAGRRLLGPERARRWLGA